MVDTFGRFIVDLRDFLEERRDRFVDLLFLVRVRRDLFVERRRDRVETRPRFEYAALRVFDILFQDFTEDRMMDARVARESFRDPSLLFTYRRQPADILDSFATRPTLVDREAVDFLTVRRRRRTVPYLERLDTAILRNFYFYTLYNIKNFEDEFLAFPVTI